MKLNTCDYKLPTANPRSSIVLVELCCDPCQGCIALGEGEHLDFPRHEEAECLDDSLVGAVVRDECDAFPCAPVTQADLAVVPERGPVVPV